MTATRASLPVRSNRRRPGSASAGILFPLHERLTTVFRWGTRASEGAPSLPCRCGGAAQVGASVVPINPPPHSAPASKCAESALRGRAGPSSVPGCALPSQLRMSRFVRLVAQIWDDLRATAAFIPAHWCCVDRHASRALQQFSRPVPFLILASRLPGCNLKCIGFRLALGVLEVYWVHLSLVGEVMCR